MAKADVAVSDEPTSIFAKKEHNIVSVLEHMLKRAREGEFRQVAVIATTPEGGCVQAFGGGGKLLEMVGAVEDTKAWLLQHLKEQQRQ